MLIYGINPVIEAIRARRAVRVVVSRATRDAANPRLAELIALARAERVRVETVDAVEVQRLAAGGVHQGVVAEVEQERDWGVTEIVRAAQGPPLVVVLDGIEDPHNLGAILRPADAAGASGVVRQQRRAAPLGGVAAKASAGAIAHVRIANVVNIARALDELKEAGVWTIGLASDVALTYDQVDYTVPSAVVLGAEGSGLRRLVREQCDWVVSIPMLGSVESLNVSVAAGVVLFEAVRQRRTHNVGRGTL